MRLSPALLTRRSVLQRGAIGSAGLWFLADARIGRARAAVPSATDVTFAEGIACGQVDTNAATLWTRIAGLTVPSRLQVEVSGDPGFGSTLISAETIADPAAGGAARLRIGGSVLEPGMPYWYRFIAGDGTSSPVGRIKTALPADSMEPVKIAWFSCQDFIVGNYAAHRDLAAHDDIDMAICVGDYIYEKAFFDGQVRSVPVTPDGQVRTLDEYRAQYECYHSDPNLRAVRAKMPLVAIWDDHEVEDNYAGLLPGGQSEQGRPIPFAQRRAAAYQAWFESMPVIRDPAVPDRIYGSRRVGQVELFSIDDRQ